MTYNVFGGTLNLIQLKSLKKLHMSINKQDDEDDDDVTVFGGSNQTKQYAMVGHSLAWHC